MYIFYHLVKKVGRKAELGEYKGISFDDMNNILLYKNEKGTTLGEERQVAFKAIFDIGRLFKV